jgi:triosephosphate isomerase
VGKHLIIANWKMHLNIHEGSLLVHKLDEMIQNHRTVEVVLAPGFLSLQSLNLQINHAKFKLAAQNFFWRDEGAFTGEVSANQLRGLVGYALVGHSERRHIFGEAGREIGRKVQAAIRHDIKPVLCVGETAMERHDGETNDVLHDQLVAGLANVTSEDMKYVAIAYEPVWAIGTGDNAMPDDVERAVQAIRRQIQHMFGAQVAKDVPVLYGGSVSKDNATSYLNAQGVNGLLVGGASLHAEQFAGIIKCAHESLSSKR